MAKAVRAIILDGDKLLAMHRNKHGEQYFTLVGGRVNEGEALEQALVREVKEETGLDVTSARLVFIEEHPAPYNEQYIYLCQVAPHDSVAITDSSEEGLMNRVGINVHTPVWLNASNLEFVHFRTPDLHKAIIHALKHGFPSAPVKL